MTITVGDSVTLVPQEQARNLYHYWRLPSNLGTGVVVSGDCVSLEVRFGLVTFFVPQELVKEVS